MTQEQPLPCPFCGCKPTVAGDKDNYNEVYCKSSRCYVAPSTGAFGKAKAIKQWNKRA